MNFSPKRVFLPNIAYSLFVFVFLFFLIIIDLEVPELIRVLRGSNHTKPVPQVIFLQVLLGQILKVTFAEWDSRGQHNLVLFTAKGNVLSEIIGFATNLKSINKQFIQTTKVGFIF